MMFRKIFWELSTSDLIDCMHEVHTSLFTTASIFVNAEMYLKRTQKWVETILGRRSGKHHIENETLLKFSLYMWQ